MAELKRRVKNGVSYGKYIINEQINGERIHRALHENKRIAEEMRDEIRREHSAGRYGHIPGDTAWEPFKERYLAWAKGTKAKSSLAHDNRAIAFLEDFRPITKINQVTPHLLEELRAHLNTNKHLKPGINRAIQALKTIMRRAEDWNYVRPQKWASVKKFRVPKGRVDFLTEDEFETLFEFCSSDYERDIAVTYTFTGVRASEGFWLELTDLFLDDLDNSIVRIIPKPEFGFVPKDYECRDIAIDRPVAEYFLKLKKRKLKENPKARFVLSDGNWRPSSAEALGAEFRKNVLKGAGLAARGRLHILRHTYASWLVQKGVDIYAVKELLGHATVTTTEIYAHLRPATLHSAVSKLPTHLIKSKATSKRK